jgi:hypothetical protein
LSIHLLAEVFTAVGTVLVAILAIWGDFFKAFFAGPKLELSLSGLDLTVRNDGTPTYYFRINVKNRRTWAAAEGARVQIVGIARRSKLDGSFKRESLAVPVQLFWVPAERASERELIIDAAICDFGYLDMKQLFKLATMNTPNNFNGQMYEDNPMRVQVRVSAQNMRPRNPIVIEVFWDGQFVLDPNAMEKHLLAKEVPSLTGR